MYNSQSQQKQKNNGQNTKLSGWIIPFWITYVSILGFLMLLFILISLGWIGYMPSFTELENPSANLATEVISEDGELLGTYYLENRSNCKYSDLSQPLKDALIATEDSRFYKHSGVDGRALLRVAGGVLTFHHKGGGSTITQQLAKNLFPRGQKMNKVKLVFIKFKEWVVATKLERKYSKDEILAMYFNTVDFGNQAVGIKSAARTYFDKSPSEINTEEAALLVGMLKAPSKYSPRRHYQAAIGRRNVVLGQMKKYGYLTEAQFDSIKELPIDMTNFKSQAHYAGKATYFREYLRLVLKDWCANNPKKDGSHYDLYCDGLKIYTTIDSRMQQHAEEAVKEHVCDYLQPMFFQHFKGVRNAPFVNLSEEQTNRILWSAAKRSERYDRAKDAGLSDEQIKAEFNKKVPMTVFSYKGMRDTVMTPFDSIRYYKSFLQCGLMCVEAKSGHVKAYVGGTNYEYFQFDHVKLSKRQVGSTFKPYVYTVAMQSGEFDPCTMVPNVPVTIDVPGGTWTPRNSGAHREGEMMPLREALAFSLNQVSAYLMKRYGPEAVISLVRNMGMTSDIPAVPAICLGACELTLYEQVGAINCFPNQGVYVEPIFITRICDKDGNVIYNKLPKTNEAIDQITAFKTVRLMQGVVDYGTGGRLRSQYKLDFPVAGKTGTTDNQSDGWFVGYTPLLTCGVWVGCEDRSAHFRSTALGQGARTAMPVFGLFMKKVYSDPKLPYYAIVNSPTKTAQTGYYFTIPSAYTGDESGCNENTSAKPHNNLDFD
ncbi:MAG: transglycosylase domain-containing protein [Bacteroidales bacterium]|nr:transglycosylase domain-containing protein [Bacteroidales bacterium]MBR0304229.1 transglycosylase domain-containing protein [Bacteroidales bacterium]